MGKKEEEAMEEMAAMSTCPMVIKGSSVRRICVVCATNSILLSLSGGGKGVMVSWDEKVSLGCLYEVVDF